MLRIPERVVEKNLNPIANLQTYPQEQWAVQKWAASVDYVYYVYNDHKLGVESFSNRANAITQDPACKIAAFNDEYTGK